MHNQSYVSFESIITLRIDNQENNSDHPDQIKVKFSLDT